MTRLLAALLLSLLALPAFAQGNGPVQITSDTFVVDEAKTEATFEGNVLVVREGMTVWADRLVVEYGKAGMNTISEMVATGKVRLKTEDQDATGEQAVFNPKTQVLVMTGNVIVVNSAGTVAGPRLEVNLADNTSVFTAAAGARVTGVFTTE